MEIDEVRINERLANMQVKFILAEVSNGKEKLILFRSSGAEYHSDIYEQLKSELKERMSAEVLGGGWLIFDPGNRLIKIWGRSSNYGQADYKTACKLLQNRYPDFKIESP